MSARLELPSITSNPRVRACGVAVREGKRCPCDHGADSAPCPLLRAPSSHGPRISRRPCHPCAARRRQRRSRRVGVGRHEQGHLWHQYTAHHCQKTNQAKEAFREAITGPLRSTSLDSLSDPERVFGRSRPDMTDEIGEGAMARHDMLTRKAALGGGGMGTKGDDHCC